MTGNAIPCHTATWSREEPGTLLITDTEGSRVGSYAVTQAGDCPGPEILLRTGWVAYPGSEWLEEPLDHWSRAVFEESRPGGEKR
jgi:hypothetical protein